MQYRLIEEKLRRSLRSFSVGELFVVDDQVGIMTDEGAVLLGDGSKVHPSIMVKPCRQVEPFIFKEV